MTEQEQKDLDILKAEQIRIKLACFEHLRYIHRYTERDLEISGFRGFSVAEAMKKNFETSQKEIEKLTDAYIRKYPDEK